MPAKSAKSAKILVMDDCCSFIGRGLGLKGWSGEKSANSAKKVIFCSRADRRQYDGMTVRQETVRPRRRTEDRQMKDEKSEAVGQSADQAVPEPNCVRGPNFLRTSYLELVFAAIGLDAAIVCNT